MKLLVDYIPDDNLIRVTVEVQDMVLEEFCTIAEAHAWAERFEGAAEQAERNA